MLWFSLSMFVVLVVSVLLFLITLLCIRPPRGALGHGLLFHSFDLPGCPSPFSFLVF